MADKALCKKHVGQGWDQEEACSCILKLNHSGECRCKHTVQKPPLKKED